LNAKLEQRDEKLQELEQENMNLAERVARLEKIIESLGNNK